MNKEINDDFPFPYAVIDEKNNIISYNKKFACEFFIKQDSENYITISDIIENYSHKIREQKAIIRAKCYTVFTTEYDEKNYNVFIIPNYCNTGEECRINKVVVSLIFIDNYTEVLDSVEDVRHPLLIAVIDRKINSMAYNLGGILRKFENDKYIFLFSYDKMTYLKENKFEILDQIREIDMGNTIPATLSIGIGLNGQTLSKCMEYARAAIDLALSRGGDQVVIKDNEKITFFGGKSKEIGVNTRVKARVKAYALTELIQEAENVIIMGHKHTDLDCLGAAVGVFKIVDSMNKKCNIILGDITTSVSKFYTRLIDENKYEECVFINSQKAKQILVKNTLLIVVDTHKPSICECPELIKKASKIVVFDHHRKGAEFIDNAVLTYHEPYASSTCELITEMFLYIDKNIKLSKIEADGLLAGITVDTKNFAFKTGTKTFEAAAFLKRNGADTIRVKMLFQNTIENYTAKARVISRAKRFHQNMAISYFDEETENPLLITAQASDELLNIEGIEASFVLCKCGDEINVSARSLGNVNVQIIMEKLGGGGHQTVSGVQIKGKSLEEAVNMLKNSINEYLSEIN